MSLHKRKKEKVSIMYRNKRAFCYVASASKNRLARKYKNQRKRKL